MRNDNSRRQYRYFRTYWFQPAMPPVALWQILSLGLIAGIVQKPAWLVAAEQAELDAADEQATMADALDVAVQ